MIVAPVDDEKPVLAVSPAADLNVLDASFVPETSIGLGDGDVCGL